MIRVIRICRKCGAKIFSDAPEGLCTGCVLETALGILPRPSVATGDSSAVAAYSAEATPKAGSAEADDCGSAQNVEASDANAAPHHKKAAGAAAMLGKLGDYELLEEIGRGGQGVVYRARQKSLNRTVALKVIGLGQWATKAHLKRFRLEAEAAASLNHPCIVPIYEVGERDGSCYFSMGLVEGGQLDRVAKREPMSIRHAAQLIAKLARTVHYAHERGILHRDIKPGNVLLDAKGEPHLTDFGLARLVESESTVTRTLEVMGTPSYMAPEQAAGNNAAITSATDVYGLGAVLYQLLTGHPPFAGGTTYETIRLLLNTEPRQPRLWNRKIGRDLATICLKCLEKDPRRRYCSALALGQDLERWLKHEPIRAKRSGLLVHARKWVRRNPTIAVMAALVLILSAAVSMVVWKSEMARRPMPTGIAVLPFENLSQDRENAFFADGVQDDILTKLAKIADLKVISRTSVMQYRGKRNLRQIGNELRVSHVLEGSIRRTGPQLHINAQLIDTRTDTHIWAEQYDRVVDDVFAIQSEIIQQVARQLHAKISPAERLVIERPPTFDLSAFDLYTRAKNLSTTALFGSSMRANFLEAIDLLDQAVARDPSFFQAYCELAQAHGNLYYFGYDHTSARLGLAEGAIQAASRLRPDAGEMHLARAWHLYLGHRDFDGALAELEVARKTLPNEARIFELSGYIERRRPDGNREGALRRLQRALELDPRNVDLLQQTALLCNGLGRHAEAKLMLDRVLAIVPNDASTKISGPLWEFEWKADTQPLHQMIDSIRATNPAAMRSVAGNWLVCALGERDAAAAKEALIILGENGFCRGWVHLNRQLMEGVIARMMKDENKARSAFIAARAEQEKTVQAQPDYGPALVALGLIDAGLGHKEEALREGRRAVELQPVEKGKWEHMSAITYLAMIAAWVGEKDLACEQLAQSPPNYGELKLLPFWDPLRGEPCFEKIVTSLAPK
jgi:TolB-like protein/Tfp pilus assembly protein PilF/predicted Ser/Thr protein kinase